MSQEKRGVQVQIIQPFILGTGKEDYPTVKTLSAIESAVDLQVLLLLYTIRIGSAISLVPRSSICGGDFD